MKSKTVWTTGGVIFLVAFVLLWNTNSGGHGVVWQALGIFGLFNIACLIFGIGLVLTYPDDPNYVPPKKPKKRRKKKEVDVAKVLGVTLKAAFFPATFILYHSLGFARRRRRRQKREEFWIYYDPWY